MAICPLNDFAKTCQFKEHIHQQSPLGFRHYFYLLSNNSEHFNKNHHILVTLVVTPAGEPSYRHLASGVAISKGSAGNSHKNCQDMLRLLGPCICTHYGEGTNDNAGGAQAEIRATLEQVAEACWSAGLGDELCVNGVERLPIQYGNPYHIANLTVMHFSRTAFDEKMKLDHRQKHHLQVLQSAHTLHSKDPAFSQLVLDWVMARSAAAPGDSPSFKESDLESELANQSRPLRMMTWAEKEVQWMVNQRNTRWMTRTNRLLMPDGHPALVAWAMEFSNIVQSDWQCHVGCELAV